jgi:hypothetical protein
VAPLIWERLGDVPLYVEPFAGSLAVLLARPHAPQVETITDADGLIANVWRAIAADPEAVARYADDIVAEVDLHARHAWLVRVRAELTEKLLADPAYYDARAAGWWVWGASCWIGSGWCSGRGPWQVEDGHLRRSTGPGVGRQIPHLGDAGMGVHALGVGRQIPHLGNAGRGVHALGARTQGIWAWMAALAARLRRVRICCGDWTRIMGPSPTINGGITGVLLDPPYRHAERAAGLYAHDQDVWDEVRAWAGAHGDDARYRIALCGYSDSPAAMMPAGWTWHRWKTGGGYGSQATGRGRENARREVIWYSPHCLHPLASLPLFRAAASG